MEHSIGRYLLSNSAGRWNGYEKAEMHIELSAIFLSSKILCSIDMAKRSDYLMKIHDATRPLTDCLDVEIGFPIDEPPEDYDEFERKFFARFIELAEKEFDRLRALKIEFFEN